jgi:hypothetical protein
MIVARTAIVLAGIALVAGCSGGSTTPSPTPTATPTPQPSPTQSPGAATATFVFGASLSPSAKSASVVFSTGAPIVAALPTGCAASQNCSITVSAPVGNQKAYRVYAYPSTNGTGTAVGIGTGDATFLSGQTTKITVALEGVMNSYTLAFTQANLVSQIATGINISVVAKDVTGATLTGPYLTTNDDVPSISVAATDSTGASTSVGTITIAGPPNSISYSYSGILPNPVKFTATLSGYASASVPIAFAQPTGTVGYALLQPQGLGVALYPTGTTTVSRSYVLPGSPVRFDPSGTIWAGLSGVKTDGTVAGPIPLQNATLLSFDPGGRVYVATQSNNPVINVYTLGPSDAPTLVRSVTPASNPCSAAADAAQNLYVATCSKPPFEVSEFASGTNGNTPTTSNTSATAPVALDSAGDLYAYVPSTDAIGIWPSGTFGPAVPSRSLTAPPCSGANSMIDLAVDLNGNVYALSNGCSGSPSLYYYASGTSTPQLLSVQSTSVTAPF